MPRTRWIPIRNKDRVWIDPDEDEGGGGYVAPAVNFDGSAKLTATSLTATDNSLISWSVWFKADIASGPVFWSVDPDNVNTPISYGATYVEPGNPALENKIRVYFADPDFNAQAMLTTDDIAQDVWHNLLFSANTNQSAGNKIFHAYVDDVDVSGDIGDSDDAFQFVMNGNKLVVGSDGASVFFDGDMAEFWLAPGQFIDFSVGANRRKFIDAEGKPVYLGADGSTPTGTVPRVFFSGDASSFATNQGTGGAFTLTGTLTDAATSPSD